MRDFFEAHGGLTAAPGETPEGPRPRLRPRGRYFDLQVLYEALNAIYFERRIDAAITWGRRSGRRRRRQRSIRLGSYQERHRLIRIHPALDASHVPRYVVETVIHHEMLHAAMPPTFTASGRRRLHTAEFRARERAFPAAAATSAWLDRHLESLLR